MHRFRFEEEMAQFEAEIGGQPRVYFPPPPPPAIILNRGHDHGPPPPVMSTGPSIYAAAPQTTARPKPPPGGDEEEDILRKLEKYEKEVKKEKKLKKSSTFTSATSFKPSSVSSSAASKDPKTFVPPTIQNIQIPQSTQQRMGALNMNLPAGVKAPASVTMGEESIKKAKKQKKAVRTGGGQIWEDETLKEWDPSDFRIFCGDLGNDVTDEVLARVFGRYPSFQKAKVVRDKKSNKTKGYGFVSFKDPTDFTKAMREMNGKYVGSRPIKMRKSNWKDRNIDVVRQKQKLKQEMGYKW